MGTEATVNTLNYYSTLKTNKPVNRTYFTLLYLMAFQPLIKM